jgi:hypothetical protein
MTKAKKGRVLLMAHGLFPCLRFHQFRNEIVVAYVIAIVKGTYGDKRALYVSPSMGKGLLQVEYSAGGGIAGGAGSGGNLKTAHDGSSPGYRLGPAPDMVKLCMEMEGVGDNAKCAEVDQRMRGKTLLYESGQWLDDVLFYHWSKSLLYMRLYCAV